MAEINPWEGNAGDPCEQCGLCCRIFGDSISPTTLNLFSWMEAGRKEILAHFSACKSNGEWICCSELDPADLGDVITVEMRDPDSGEYPTVCPFLRRVGKRRYICGIHEFKPEMCRNYRPWIWGETFFNRCRALMKSGAPGRKKFAD